MNREQVDRALVRTVNRFQSENRGRLLGCPRITDYVAKRLEVSTALVRWRLTEAVARGDLLEILLRRDYLVIWPVPNSLPPVYAVPDNETHRLSLIRPESRGANRISFLMSPAVYRAYIEQQREEIRNRELA